MKRRPKISGRVTSLRAAFVRAIIPWDADPVALAAAYSTAGFKDGECVYCGSRATDYDHLHPLVRGGQSSGQYHTNDNLVPSCGPCNQSKSGSDWKIWMQRRAAAAPERADDTANRMVCIERFEEYWTKGNTQSPTERTEADKELTDAYWKLFDEIKVKCAEADRKAAEIRANLGYAK